jgi:hypothetical protein
LTATTSSVVASFAPVTSNSISFDGHTYTVTIPSLSLDPPNNPQQSILASIAVTDASSGGGTPPPPPASYQRHTGADQPAARRPGRVLFRRRTLVEAPAIDRDHRGRLELLPGLVSERTPGTQTFQVAHAAQRSKRGSARPLTPLRCVRGSSRNVA